MNLNRLFKTRIFFITLILTVVCLGLLARLETEESVRTLDQVASSDFSYEDLYADITASGYILMMVGIFAVVYIEEERKSGFLKNLLVEKNGKKKVFAAKIPAVFLCTLIMFLGSMITIRLGSLGRGAEMYRLCSSSKLIRFTFFEVLLHTAFGIALMSLYEITRNTIVPIIVTIIASGNMHGMLLAFLEKKLVKAFPVMNGFMEKYALSGNLIVTKTEELGDIGVSFPYANVVAVTVIGLVVYSVLGMLIFTKRDTI